MQLSTLFPSRSLVARAPVADITGGALLLPFKVQPQELSQWCWAAVTASVVAYLAPQNAASWTQCAIASDQLNTHCCLNPRPRPCDIPYFLDRPLTKVGHLREPPLSYLDPQSVAAELDQSLPIPIRVQWNSGGGHFLAIRGIRKISSGIQLAVTDPIYEESAIMGNALIQGGYQSAGGHWTHSYVVKR